MRREPGLAVAIVAALAACGDWEPPAAGFVLAVSPAWTTEAGGTAAVDVSLATAPTAPVVVDLLTGDATEGAIVDATSGQPITWATLVFTPADWSTPQRVTVVGIDDDARDGDVPWQLMLLPSSDDDRYETLDAGRVTFTNEDDDTPGILVSRATLTTWETAGSTDSFTVRLAGRPTYTVTIPVQVSRPAEGLLRSSTTPNVTDPAVSLVFTPSDWSTPREVIVAGQDDPYVDGDQQYLVTVGPASGDPSYADLPAQFVTVTNRDDDGTNTLQFPGVGIEEGLVAEICVGTPGTPAADVLVELTTGDPTEVLFAPKGSSGPWVERLVLTLPSGVAQASACFSLLGVQDYTPDGTVQAWASVGPTASIDPAYDGLPARTMWISVANVTPTAAAPPDPCIVDPVVCEPPTDPCVIDPTACAPPPPP